MHIHTYIYTHIWIIIDDFFAIVLIYGILQNLMIHTFEIFASESHVRHIPHFVYLNAEFVT